MSFVQKIGENMTNTLTEAPAPQMMTPSCNLNVKKILVAVDLSPQSEKTVSFAVSLTKPLGAYISLVHVCSPEETVEVTDKQDEDPMFVSQERLENLAKEVRKTYPSCS